MFSRCIVSSLNLALPQDSHYLRGSARDLWTVPGTVSLKVETAGAPSGNCK
jgi:hypothetical protein